MKRIRFKRNIHLSKPFNTQMSSNKEAYHCCDSSGTKSASVHYTWGDFMG